MPGFTKVSQISMKDILGSIIDFIEQAGDYRESLLMSIRHMTGFEVFNSYFTAAMDQLYYDTIQAEYG